jgi:fatty acyl-CoA reductase
MVTYHFATRFDNGNTQKLMEDMSFEELKDFGFNEGSINWRITSLTFIFQV